MNMAYKLYLTYAVYIVVGAANSSAHSGFIENKHLKVLSKQSYKGH